MFSLFSHTEEKEKLTLILEIQSGLVRGAVVAKGDQKSKILARHESAFSLGISRRTSAYLKKVMLKSVAEVARTLTQRHHLESVHIIMSSPWALSHSKTVKMSFDNDETVDSKMISSIIEDDRKTMEIEDLVYIEKKIFEIKLNGYVVNDYEGREARELSVSFATSLSSRSLLRDIHKTLERFMRIRNVQHHSNLLLDFIVIGRILEARNDYTYIHVHKELTDVIVVKSNICEHISSFPTGTSALEQEIPGSLLNLTDTNAIAETEANAMSARLNAYFDSWIAQVDGLVDMKVSPRFVYISADQYLNLFKKRIAEHLGDAYYVRTYEPDTLEMYSLALIDML